MSGPLNGAEIGSLVGESTRPLPTLHPVSALLCKSNKLRLAFALSSRTLWQWSIVRILKLIVGASFFHVSIVLGIRVFAKGLTSVCKDFNNSFANSDRSWMGKNA